jgi:hypothetical protein
MTALAQHSAATPEHGTPDEWLELGRRVLGGEYDLDPSSSAMWNERVRAKRFIDAQEDALRADWGVFPGMRISCNPAGGIVQELWDRVYSAWLRGACAMWWGFSLEQLIYLQRRGLFDLSLRRLIPAKRIAWIKGFAEPAQASLFGAPELPAPVAGESPTHGNYVVLMPSPSAVGDGQVQRFKDEARLMSVEVW